MMGTSVDWNGAAIMVGGWLLTYVVHSTLLLGAAALITKVAQASEALADVVWKVALVGGLLTSLVVVAGDVRPLGGRLVLSGERAAPRFVGLEESIGVGSSARERGGAVEDARSLSEERMPRVDGSGAGGVAGLRVADGGSGKGARGAGLPMMWLAVGLTWIWVVGALAMVVRLVVRRRNLFALLGRRVPVKTGPALDAFEELRHAALIRRGVSLTSAAACPLPLALTSSEVCVPDRFLMELDAEEQRGALAHEIAHLARRDPTWLMLAMAIEALMFFQPLNRLARRRLKESAEYLCDEWAAGEGAGLGLARCLARVAVWLRPGADPLLPATSAIADGRSGLVRRVERLLTGQAAAGRGRAKMGFGLATALMLVVIGAAPAVSVTRPVVSDARESRAMQEVVVRAPRMQDAIGQRWDWALTEARLRGYRRFWVVYAFHRPVGAQEQYLSDSDGVNIDESLWRGTPLRSVLGADSERGTIAVMVRFGSASGDDAIDRIGHRSMT
ncbi:MAG: M56 family metallopeptidase, partial [Longimicrobiales bacterium]